MNRLPHIFFLILSVLSYGQVSLRTLVEDKDYKVGQRLTVAFVLRIDGDDLEQESPLRLPDFSKFNVIGNASDQNIIVDPIKKTTITETVYQWVLEPKTSGKVRIGSVLVDINGKTYKTEPVDILVKEAERKPENPAVAKSDDVYLNMEVQNREVYENQPTVAVLRVYSKNFDNFRRVQNIQFPRQKAVNFQPVSFEKQEIETSSSRKDYASQVVAVFIIFPNIPGKVEVPPVSASFAGTENPSKIVSNRVNLTVKGLPKGSPAAYKNAVGNFAVHLTKDSSDVVPEVGKPLSVTVKISGTGNFNNIHAPKLAQSADYTFYRPNIQQAAQTENDGIRGQIISRYVVVPNRPGNIDISTENFSYFDPAQKKYVDLGPQSFSVNVMTSDQVANAQTAIERVNEYTNNVLQKVNNPIIPTTALQVKEKKSLNWKVVFINLALILSAAILVFAYQKKFRQRKEKAAKKAGKPLGSVAETEAELRAATVFNAKEYADYFKNLIGEKKYDTFFKSFDDFLADADTFAQKNNFKNFNSYLETTNGSRIADTFRHLVQKIQLEKFSPSPSEAGLQQLVQEFGELLMSNK